MLIERHAYGMVWCPNLKVKPVNPDKLTVQKTHCNHCEANITTTKRKRLNLNYSDT